MLVLVWAAIVAAVGIPLYLTGVTGSVDPITLNVIASLIMVAPVTFALAWLESSRWHATLGKRALGIRVVGTSRGTNREVDPAASAARRTSTTGTNDDTSFGTEPATAMGIAARISFGTALLRNALKIALPWLIGHAAVIAITDSGAASAPSVGVWVLTLAAYALPIVYVVSLFLRRGATPYDVAARTAVVSAL
jgi:uncharacterized RDD family membrane protein YckC